METYRPYKSRYALEDLPPIPNDKEGSHWLMKTLTLTGKLLEHKLDFNLSLIKNLIKEEKYESCVEIRTSNLEIQKDLNWMNPVLKQIEDRFGPLPEQENKEFNKIVKAQHEVKVNYLKELLK